MDKDEKILNLLEKMYFELKTGQENMQQELKDLKVGQEEIRQSQVRMENKFDEKIKILFDAQAITEEKIYHIEHRLDKIELKIM